MQKVDIDLLNVLSCMTPITFLLQTRDTFDDIEVKAKSYVQTKEYKEAILGVLNDANDSLMNLV